MAIQTVLGPISADELGPTSMHEHVFADFRIYRQPAVEGMPADGRVTAESLEFVRRNPLVLEDNLLFDATDAVVDELSAVVALGGAGLVECTTAGIGRSPEVLQQVARRAGLHIMMGCGWYVHDSHPGLVERSSVDELTAILVGELRDGVAGTGIRPALMGEIGTGAPWTDRERKVVAACGAASAETGAAVSIHLQAQAQLGLEVLEALQREGARPERVILGHMDGNLDRGYHLAVAEAGAVLAYDCFGQEYEVPGHYKDPTDVERLAFVELMLAEGRASQLVLGCDVWLKFLLRTFGGTGYEHLLARVVPALREDLGVPDDVIEQLLVGNPRRLLDRP